MILRAFAATGRVPDPAVLIGAMPAGYELGVLPAELHDRDVTRLDDGVCRITSADPTSGARIDVTVDGVRADWRPDMTVVFVGADTAASADNGCPPQPGGEPCCGVMNFFTSTDTASVWLAAHPRVSGTILIKEQALRLGVDIFGPLLDDGTGMPHDASGVRL